MTSEQVEVNLKDATVYPKNYKGLDVVITADDCIKIQSAKDQGIIDIVKGKGYSWSGKVWFKRVTKYTGPLDDLLGEIGNALLLAGYSVCFAVENYEKVIEMAKTGNFTLENPKFVVSPKDMPKCLLITWPYYLSHGDINYYKEAKRIKGSQWVKSRGVKVPISRYQEILDYAETYHFKVSDVAKSQIESYKKELEEAVFEEIQGPMKNPDGLMERPEKDLGDLLDD